MKDTFRVGIYARLSRDDNNGNLESMSIANQRQILSDYVNEKGWILVEEYVDEHAIIGTSGENLVKSRVSALVPFNFFVKGKYNFIKKSKYNYGRMCKSCQKQSRYAIRKAVSQRLPLP